VVQWDFSANGKATKAKGKTLDAKAVNILKRLSGIKAIQNGDAPVNSLKGRCYIHREIYAYVVMKMANMDVGRKEASHLSCMVGTAYLLTEGL